MPATTPVYLAETPAMQCNAMQGQDRYMDNDGVIECHINEFP